MSLCLRGYLLFHKLMMKSNISYILLLLLFFSSSIIAQDDKTINISYSPKWLISGGFGAQMSGIKSQDFIRSNYTPLINISAGKWFRPTIALQLGYKGVYFNTISDDKKHYYSFLYIELMINANSLINKQNLNRIWNLNIHGGPGLFYNFFYSKPNLCGNLGIQNCFRINNKLHIFIDIASIVGWDIYQGDKDILPGIMLGLTYLLK